MLCGERMHGALYVCVVGKGIRDDTGRGDPCDSQRVESNGLRVTCIFCVAIGIEKGRYDTSFCRLRAHLADDAFDSLVLMSNVQPNKS